MSVRCAGIILAGGRNTRMKGHPKGGLRIAGKSFLDRIAAAVGTCTGELILVTRETAVYYNWPYRIVEDVFQVRSPLSGIHAGLLHMDAEVAFVSSCDTLFLHHAVVRMIVDQSDDASEIVVPASGTYFQPLCAVYSKACVRLIERQLSRGDPKVDHLFDQARVKSIAYEQLQSVDPQLNSFLMSTRRRTWRPQRQWWTIP